MKKNTLKYIWFLALISTPLVSSAAFDGVKGLLIEIRKVVDTVIPILFGLSLVFFFWGTSQFILHAGDAKTREEGKQKMIWGVIALFVFVSIFGIIKWISILFGVEINGSLLVK